MSDAPTRLLRAWLQRQVPPSKYGWLEEQLARFDADPSDRNLHIALGIIPRRLGKDDLALDSADLDAAESARPGWDPRGWSVDVAARVLVLGAADRQAQPFAPRFTELCRSADVGEAIALYRGLPLYRSPESLHWQVGEGLRTNIRAEFEAISHRNPYPREQFDENRWNHMVLKALFIGSALHPVQGLDDRANRELARILCDYAHERWAASRSVTPELWRCVGPFAEGEMLSDLERVVDSSKAVERKAAALALAASPASAARDLLYRAGDVTAAIERGELTWHSLFSEAQA